MSAADQVIEVERAATNAAVCRAGYVVFWACIAARSRDNPSMCGQALGYSMRFALDLVESGAEPRDVHSLLAAATIGGAP